MRTYKNLIIGFGKAGKTLATKLALKGETTALVEKSANMYGGTCINVACIPTKALEHNAHIAHAQGGDDVQKSWNYYNAINEKRKLTAMLRQKNFDKLVTAGVKIFTGTAAFIDKNTVEVALEDGTTEEIYGDRIFINTGSTPFIPNIPGLKESQYVYTSESLMELEELPPRFAIIGAGYIGLEFASMFCNFGAEVTIINNEAEILTREDKDMAAVLADDLLKRGIKFINNAKTQAIQDGKEGAIISLNTDEGDIEIVADAVLVATGRRANVASLNLENAGVKLTERGTIAVDENLLTNVSNIWAMGDVAGSPQFTYISLDDFRIVFSQLVGDGKRNSKNRGNIPYSVFLDPPLSRIGFTEEEAIKAGYKIAKATLPASAIPNAHILKSLRGLLKVIVDKDTNLILGAHIYCAESHELINIVKVYMDNKLPYTALRDAIYTHPTMAEGFNDLLGGLK